VFAERFARRISAGHKRQLSMTPSQRRALRKRLAPVRFTFRPHRPAN
jgi:hypothetical protein